MAEIDSLEIKIESSASQAAERVSSLAAALNNLKTSGAGKFLDSVKNKFTSVGTAAKNATETAKRLKILDNISKKVQSATGPKQAALSRAAQTIDASKFARSLSQVDKQIEQTSHKIESLKARFNELVQLESDTPQNFGAGERAEIDKLSKGLSELRQVYSALSEQRTEMWKNFSSLKNTSEPLQESNFSFAGNLKAQFDAATSSAETFKKAISSNDTLGTIFDGVKKSAVDATSQIMAADPKIAAVVLAIKVAADALKKYFDEIQEKFEQLKSWLQSVGLQIGAFAKQVSAQFFGNLGNQLKSVGESIASRLTAPFKDAAKAVTKFKNSIGRVVFYRMIRSAIQMVTDGFKEGIDNLYQYSSLVGSSFAPAMNSLATSAQYLKNSLGAMAAPLIEALAPAIETAINLFVELLNTIGRVFAILTGKSTYTQAIRAAASYGGDLDKSMAGAAKSAKDFQRYLIGIDELNIIDTQNSIGGGSGGGGGSAGGGLMFEEVPVEGLEWADGIKDAIENGDWYSVGEILADKLNEVVENWDAKGWGEFIGEKINNGLTAAQGFLETFEFDDLGAKLADALDGAIESIDPSVFGSVLAGKWNAIIDTFSGFVREMDNSGTWDDLGDWLSDAINSWIETIDLAKAGEALGTALRGVLTTAVTALENSNFSDLATKLGNAINKFLDEYAKGQAEGFGFGTLLADMFNESIKALDASLDTEAILHLGEVISKDIHDFIEKIKLEDAAQTFAKLLKQLIDSGITLFDDTQSWALLGEKIGKSLKEFFRGKNDWLSGVGTLVGKAIHDVVTAVDNFADQFTFEDWIHLGHRVAESVNNFFREMTPEDWGNLGEALHSLGEGLLTAAKTAVEMIDWGEINDSLEAFLDGLDITELQTSFHDLFRRVYENAAPIIMDIFSEIGGFVWTGFWQGVFDKIDETWSKVEAFFGDIVDNVKRFLGINSPSTVFAEIGGNVIAGLLEGISGAWGTITGFFNDTLGENGLFGLISGAWSTIQQNAGTAWSGIKETVGGWWDQITGKTSESLGETERSADTTWGNISRNTDDTFGTVKKTIDDSWSNIAGTVATEAGNVYQSIKDNFSDADLTLGEKTRNIMQVTADAFKNVKSSIVDSVSQAADTLNINLGDISSSVSGTFSGIVSKATGWGKDLCNNMASGIRGAISNVTSAVRTVANKIRDFLGFSEPDLGPLSNFHTFMPDMLDLMAKGIKQNTYKATNAVAELSREMAAQFSDLSYDAPKPVFSGVTETSMEYRLAYAGGPDYDGPDGQESMSNGMRSANEELINAVYAVGERIMAVVRENGQRPIVLNGRKVSDEVTDEQARASRMYGR